MAYFTLLAADGYLVREASLDTEMQAEAEQFAARRIDDLFHAWDRSAWTGVGVPDQIAEAAELLGVGHYLELRDIAAGGASSPERSWSEMLKERGELAAANVLGQGGPRNASGDIIGPARQGQLSTRFSEVWGG